MTPADHKHALSLGLPAPSVGDIVSLPRMDVGVREGRLYRVVAIKEAAPFVGGWSVWLQPKSLPPYKSPKIVALGHIRTEQANGSEPARLDADATAIPKTILTSRPRSSASGEGTSFAAPGEFHIDTETGKRTALHEEPTGSRKVDVRTRERNVVEDIAAWLERVAVCRFADGRESESRDVHKLANDIRRGEWRQGVGR